MLNKQYIGVEHKKILNSLEQDPLVGNFMLEGQLENIFLAAQEVPDCGVILEIGSFLGASTIALALACLGTNKTVMCIDTFEGNTSDFRNGKDGVYWQNKNFFDLFNHNLRRYGVENCVFPIVGNSKDVARNWSYDIDLLFIDGDHSLLGMKSDLYGFYPFLKDGGILMAHDILPDRQHLIDTWETLSHHTIEHQINFKGLCKGIKRISRDHKDWIFIPTYKELDQLKRQLELLKPVDSVRQKLVVIDDGNDAELKRYVKNNHPEATYVVGNGDNYWGGSLDLGIDAVVNEMKSDDFVIFINADGLITRDLIKYLRRSKLDHPFGNAAFGFDCQIEDGPRVPNAGNITWQQNQIGISPSGVKKRRKANLVGVDAIFGRISVFPASLFVQHKMRFTYTGFKHYWCDTAFCIDAKRLHGTSFYLETTHSGAVQKRLAHENITTFTRAWQDCFSDKKLTNFNVKLRQNFVRKYFPYQSHAAKASVYYCALSVCDSLSRVYWLKLPIRVLRRILFNKMTFKFFIKTGAG